MLISNIIEKVQYGHKKRGRGRKRNTFILFKGWEVIQVKIVLKVKACFCGGSVVRNPPANAGAESLINPWSTKIPRRRKCQSIPLFLPGKSHEQRSWAG